MANEPGAAILAIFSQLIDQIKRANPTGSDDKPIGRRVYSQLVLGMPIDRDDYMNPWSPAGGSSLRDPVTPPPEDSPPGPDRQTLLAMQAAWKTSMLCKTMLAVTKDESYREYPTGRHLDVAYNTVLFGMNPKDVPPEPDDIKARRANAKKVLYKVDAEGNATFEKTPLYENYLKNVTALSDARDAYAVAYAEAMADPVKAQAWPVRGAKFQQAIDNARNALIGEGAEEVEGAFDTLNSIGNPAEAHLINLAKTAWGDWQLQLAGAVGAKLPYSLILPSNWCDPDDHDGWQKLTVDRSSYKHKESESTHTDSAASWEKHAKTTGGSGGVMFGFAAFGGSGATGRTSESWQNSSSTTFASDFSNDAQDLHIELEYGLCTIYRPWLVSDIFFLKNWYLTDQKKNSISDGTIDGQADSDAKLLPMIPQQFLVIRNVVIRSSSWGSDGQKLSEYYGASQGQSGSDQTKVAGSGGVSLGFVSFGGTASKTEANAQGSTSSWSAKSGSGYFGTTFDGETLSIPGAQIVAFLSDITPANPELDDPHLNP